MEGREQFERSSISGPEFPTALLALGQPSLQAGQQASGRFAVAMIRGNQSRRASRVGSTA